MIPLSTAMTQTGAAERIAETLVTVVGDAGPLALVLALLIRGSGPQSMPQCSHPHKNGKLSEWEYADDHSNERDPPEWRDGLACHGHQ
jgi:hypothetical protein